LGRSATGKKKHTHTLSEYVIQLSHGNNGYPDASNFYITCTLSRYASKLL